jgi:hypothetical protein
LSGFGGDQRTALHEDPGRPVTAGPGIIDVPQHLRVQVQDLPFRNRPRLAGHAVEQLYRGIVIDGLVDFPQLLPGRGQALINQQLGFPQRQRVALDRVGCVRELQP